MPHAYLAQHGPHVYSGPALTVQEELSKLGLWIDDRKRAWGARGAARGKAATADDAGSGYTLKGTPPAGVDVATVEEMLARRVAAKKARDFEVADALQAELMVRGTLLSSYGLQPRACARDVFWRGCLCAAACAMLLVRLCCSCLSLEARRIAVPRATDHGCVGE